MYKMETKRHTESILGKLMGFERQHPNKQLRRGQQRVLSEKYLQSIAFICRHEEWSFNRFSMDMDTEMLDENDSAEEGIQSSSNLDDKTLLQSYEKEADELFQKLRLLNSTQKANQDYLKSSYLKGGKPKTSFRVRRRDTCLGKWERRVTCHGVANQVANELQQSAWQNYSKEFRSISGKNIGDCGFEKLNSFVGNRNTSKVNRNCLNNKFNVHKDWCLTPANGAISYCNSMEEVDSKSEEDLFEDCLSAPLSPVKNSDCSDVESDTSKAIERVLQELPDMLQEIGNFRNRECRKFDAIQKVADDFLTPMDESNNGFPPQQLDSASHLKDISSATHLHAVQESEVKLQQSIAEFSNTKKAKETRVLSYLVDVLAELGHHPLEDLVSLCVFDSLEKKYGKHPSWLKSERRLLFDRIKCGLSDVLSPHMSIRTRYNPLTKRHLLKWDQEVIKEELLNLLVKQEKKAKRNSSEKIVGIDRDWLDLKEDTQIVVKEIEEALISELVEEIFFEYRELC